MTAQTDELARLDLESQTIDRGEVRPKRTAGDWTGEAGRPQRPAHMLACISGDMSDLRLVRQTWLLASRLHARMTVLYILPTTADERRSEVLAGVRLFATSLGAPLVELPAFSVGDGIAEYTAMRNVTHVVLSTSQRAPWYALRRGSVLEALLPRLRGVEVYVLPDSVDRSDAVAGPGRQQP